MKVTDIRRKLAASLVAGGLMIPVASHAADLDTNLIVDPGFEDVNATMGAYGSLQLNSWSDGTISGYTYAAGQYDLGGPLAGGGARYFTSNGGADATGPGQVMQLIDVSTGDSAAAITAGEAVVSLNSFMTSYAEQDQAFLHVDFLDGSSASLGTFEISDSDTSTWSQNSGGGLIPIGTQTLGVSVYGVAGSGGPDGYQDNVDVQVSASASDFVMFLEVDTSSGAVTLNNETGQTLNIDYYEIMSDNGSGSSLLAGNGNWSSLQDQDAAGFPAGNGTGNGWEEAGNSDSDTLAESYLTGNSAVAGSTSISLGNAFNTGGAQDLTFRYGLITEITTLVGDYNADNVVNAADYTVWRDTLGDSVAAGTGADGDGSGVIDAADYIVWRDDFGNVGGPSGTSTLTTGFVRYVSPGAGQSAGVPEPSTVLLVGLGLSGLTLGRRRQTQ